MEREIKEWSIDIVKNGAKKINSDIIKGAREKIHYFIRNIRKNEELDITIIISYFGDNNNIFVDCRYTSLS